MNLLSEMDERRHTDSNLPSITVYGCNLVLLLITTY